MRASPARATGTFSARVVVALLIVGVFSFSAFVTLSTFAPDFKRGDNGAAHALSRSAIGFAGAVQLTQALGTTVTINRKAAGTSRQHLAVLTPPSTLTREQLDRLSGYATLIILPKWMTGPDLEHPGWVSRLGPLAPSDVMQVLIALAPKTILVRSKGTTKASLRLGDADFASGEISELQSLSGTELAPVVTTSDGKVVLARLRQETEVYVLADPDFLNTQGLSDVNTARAGMAILDLVRDGEPISFDVTLNGLETARNLLRLALTPPLLGATLALLAAGALLAWRSVMQSGPRIRPGRAIALGKRALAENSAALIRIAGREYTMGWRYAVLTAAIAAEQTGAPRSESSENFAMLDRVAASQGLHQSYSSLAADAANARNSTEVVAAARKLYAWTEEMLRATR